MTHKHSVYDTDKHFIVDAITRTIISQSKKTKLMQYDHNSERFTFQVPRFIDGHDMSLCDTIDIHYINLSADTLYRSTGPYPVDDMQLSLDGDDVIIFSWLISGNATAYAGTLTFAISFKCLSGSSIDYAWHTDAFSDIEIVNTVRSDGSDIIVEYHDVIAQWKRDLFGEGDSAIQRIEEAKEAAIREIEETVVEVNPEEVHQIVEDYLEENPPQVTVDQVLPSQVIFPDGASTTYAIGKVKLQNGSAMLVEPGGTLADFFGVFLDEKNPSTTEPAVSLTFSQAKAYEVGTKVTPSYSASLSAGSYTYGPATGITATAWEVTDTAGNKRTTSSDSFPQLQVVDGISYKITAKATHGAGTIPSTNVPGNTYPAGQITAGTKSATSSAITGYRNTFYGTTTNKNALTPDTIRGLAKSGKALVDGSSFTVTVPLNALRVVIAYPATLRDLTSVKDVNGMNAEIASGFSKQTLDVYGENGYSAISYKIYTMEFASANDKANKFTVTI